MTWFSREWMYRWHAFSYKWFSTKTRFARGKSQLFIHELLREPLIFPFPPLWRLPRRLQCRCHIMSCIVKKPSSIFYFHARSLVNSYRQYADRHMNLKFMWRVSAQEQAIWPFVIVKNKLMSVFNDNEFRHHIVKVVCGSTATLTMWWRNLWSITGQTHKKLTSIC